MFDNKTTFLTGAGASWHYGYPTGEELVKRVIAQANTAGEYFYRSRAQGAYLPTYVEKRVQTAERILMRAAAWEQAAKECRALAERLTRVNPPVIDYFLGHNQDLEAMGKLLIAWVILECN